MIININKVKQSNLKYHGIVINLLNVLLCGISLKLKLHTNILVLRS